MTLALPSTNVSLTPIFDDLDRHFASTLLVDELDAHYATLVTTPTGYEITVDAELVDVHDTEIHTDVVVDDLPGNLPDGIEIGAWILALGATVGTVGWLCTLLQTSGIA